VQLVELVDFLQNILFELLDFVHDAEFMPAVHSTQLPATKIYKLAPIKTSSAGGMQKRVGPSGVCT
jgi:hypothetical protein